MSGKMDDAGSRGDSAKTEANVRNENGHLSLGQIEAARSNLFPPFSILNDIVSSFILAMQDLTHFDQPEI